MKNKKGFTLIELLAVIVILAIIALIATPIVMNTIEKSKIGAAKEGAGNYAHAVEIAVASSKLETDKIEDGIYDIGVNGSISNLTNVYNVDMNGTVPTAGTVSIENGMIGYGSALLINGYNYVYDGTQFLKATDEKCFIFSDVTDGVSIKYNYSLCDEKEIVIPGFYNDKKVTQIPINGFNPTSSSQNEVTNEINSKAINTLLLPSTVKKIMNSAFVMNSLTAITIPNGVISLGANCFSHNLLTSVYIPASVITLDNGVFTNPNSLKNILKNKITEVKIKSKTSFNDFTINLYGNPTISIFGWDTGYSDSNIEWNA